MMLCMETSSNRHYNIKIIPSSVFSANSIYNEGENINKVVWLSRKDFRRLDSGHFKYPIKL